MMAGEKMRESITGRSTAPNLLPVVSPLTNDSAERPGRGATIHRGHTMNGNRKGSKSRQTTIRAWTYDQARNALPYVGSVMGSLREHWIDAQHFNRHFRRLASQVGRPDRKRLLAQEELNRQAREALEAFHEAQEELNELDVFCTDPVRGEAVIPFAHDKDLAWFIYDRFDPEPLRFWRLHSDPLDTRRPIAELPAPPAEESRVA
jgi:uncharacterized protein DUF2203